jgi:hypothetical protein
VFGPVHEGLIGLLQPPEGVRFAAAVRVVAQGLLPVGLFNDTVQVGGFQIAPLDF